MNKFFWMIVVVIGLGAAVFWVFLRGASGEIVLLAEEEVLPYEVTAVTSDGVEGFSCDSVECSYEFPVGGVDLFLEKEDHYVVEGSVELAQGEIIEILVEFEAIAGVFDASDVEVVADCYGDTVECEEEDLYFFEEDLETSYMTLWEGITRRATFVKGFEEGLIFVGGNGAVAWDSESGEAYFVDFLADSREFLFEVPELEGVMFAEGDYIVDLGSGLSWGRDGELIALSYVTDLEKVSYLDGEVYFLMLDEDGGVDFVKYDGEEYLMVLDGVEVEFEGAILLNDGESIYINDWVVRF